MIINQPDIMRIVVIPPKNKPPLFIHPNTIIAFPVPVESFKPITGRRAQVH